MALIVEDGSIVTGATSYVTRADYITYAVTKGITIANDSAADVQLVKAAEFIDGKEAQLKGTRSTRDQPMSFPRYDVVIDNWSWSSTEIPRQVILCQFALALDVNAGIDLYNPPQSASTAVKRKKVDGAVEIEYALGETQKLSRQSTSTALLNSLLRSSGLQLVRA